MQLSRTLGGCCDIIHGKEFPMNSIILTADNGTQLVCTNFHQSRKQKLKLYVWLPIDKKWVVTYAKNEYTEMMWAYYRKCEHKSRNHYKKHTKRTKNKSGSVKTVTIPKSVVWSMQHPFQGGGVSPR